MNQKHDDSTEKEPRVGWLLQCPPGLANTMQKELGFAGAIARDQKVFTKLQRNHDLMFIGRAKDESGFARSRVAEMVLRCPAYGRFKISQRQLGLMAEELKAAGPRRLVVTIAGKHFQRHDLLRFLTRELSERGAVIEDDVESEAWMFCIDQEWYFGLPVRKSRETEGRDSRTSERRGSLPPPVAAALAFASHARNDDVVVDPTCGSGSVLAEVHAFAPEARLIGFDIDADAIRTARTNLKEIAGTELHVGDARTLSAHAKGTTLMIANLPFGVQFGDRATNAALYADLIREGLNSRAPGKTWRGVFLTSDSENFETASKAAGVQRDILFKVKIRGELATAYRVTART